MIKRVFLIVLDSLGIGEAPDAPLFGDEGSNTLGALQQSPFFDTTNLTKLGLFNILGTTPDKKYANPTASFARLEELSQGKDTVSGHWEMTGIVSPTPFPTYPNGFSEEILQKLTAVTNKNFLCNKPYSGTQVILDYGKRHEETGDLILYTSADSVMQIAAHEEIVPVQRLYEYCQQARKIMQGKDAVGRIIARPFVGKYPNFVRTANRRDYALPPPKDTLLDFLKAKSYDVCGIGKIGDIFCQKGLTQTVKTKSNADGMAKLDQFVEKDFCGLCFANLVDFDANFGHRNDIDGYAKALAEFDKWLGEFLPKLKETDALVITADHGCDPSTPSTDHSREYVPYLCWGKKLPQNHNFGTIRGFTFVAQQISQLLGENFSF